MGRCRYNLPSKHSIKFILFPLVLPECKIIETIWGVFTLNNVNNEDFDFSKGWLSVIICALMDIEWNCLEFLVEILVDGEN